jgi:hypothetical protein
MIRLEALRKGLNDKNAIAPPAKMFQLKMSAFKRVAVDWGMRNLRSSFVTKCMPASENKKERELVLVLDRYGLDCKTEVPLFRQGLTALAVV